MKVRDLMTKKVVTVREFDPLSVAARLMWECDCGSIPVLDQSGERVVGMITDRDICMATWTKDRSPSSILIQEANSREIFACEPEDNIATAEALMRSKQVRRVPVLDRDKKLIGILSLADIAMASKRSGMHASAGELADIAVTLENICSPRAGQQHGATVYT